jgi:hypothetical protein
MVDIGWVMKDLIKSEVQRRWSVMVLCIPKGSLLGVSGAPAESVSVLYCSIEADMKGDSGWLWP